MATRKLYELDVLARTFTAQVLTCTPAKGGYAVTLDQTLFFPEGGGQMCDTGTLGGAQVTDVHERGGEIIHLCSAALSCGETVQGEIDWAHRLDQMQQHSGEHMVSGLIHARFGYDNVGFHIGKSEVTLDFNGTFPDGALADIERTANEAIWENRPIAAYYPGREALESIVYRQKKPLEGDIRIVSIPGCDTCACCGTHVPYTGMVGLIKIVDAMHYKGGTRITIHCGNRALRDYAQKHDAIRAAGALLCVKALDVPAAAQRLMQTRDALNAQLDELSNALFEAQKASSQGRVFLPCMRAPQMKKSAAALSELYPLGAVFAGSAQGGWAFALCAQPGAADAGAACRALCKALGGKGGGSPEMAQGTLPAAEQELIVRTLDTLCTQ